jgi:phosphatidylserine decarboxylase
LLNVTRRERQCRDGWGTRPVHQNISVTESDGKVIVTNVINGKLLP